MAYLNTLDNYHLVQQLLLFRHHDQQLHDRNHKGPQRIELHQYQSHLTVTKYRSKLSITPTYQKKKKTITPSVHKKLMKVKCNNLTKKSQKTMLISNWDNSQTHKPLTHYWDSAHLPKNNNVISNNTQRERERETEHMHTKENSFVILYKEAYLFVIYVSQIVSLKYLIICIKTKLFSERWQIR